MLACVGLYIIILNDRHSWDSYYTPCEEEWGDGKDCNRVDAHEVLYARCQATRLGPTLQRRQQ